MKKKPVLAIFTLVALLAVSIYLTNYQKDGGQLATVKSNSNHVRILLDDDAGVFPKSLQATPGSTIVFVNNETAPRHIVSSDGSLADLNSFDIEARNSYAIKIDDVGTYHYHDQLEPSFSGTITIKN